MTKWYIKEGKQDCHTKSHFWFNNKGYNWQYVNVILLPGINY